MRKYFIILLFLAVSFAFTGPLFSEGTKEKSDQGKLIVTGLRIAKKAYNGENTLRPFHQSPEISVVLQGVFPKSVGTIVSLDKKASQITTFGDDQGTDFLSQKHRFGRFGWDRYSKDRRAFNVEIRSNVLPAASAKTIDLVGELKVITAQGKEELKKKGVLAKKGTTFQVGGVDFDINKVGKPRWGKAKFSMSLQFQFEEKIAGIKFLGPDGKDLKGKRRSRMSMGSTHVWTYHFSEKTEMMTVVLEVWKGRKVHTLPFSFKKMGVGF